MGLRSTGGSAAQVTARVQSSFEASVLLSDWFGKADPKWVPGGRLPTEASDI